MVTWRNKPQLLLQIIIFIWVNVSWFLAHTTQFVCLQISYRCITHRHIAVPKLFTKTLITEVHSQFSFYKPHMLDLRPQEWLIFNINISFDQHRQIQLFEIIKSISVQIIFFFGPFLSCRYDVAFSIAFL